MSTGTPTLTTPTSDTPPMNDPTDEGEGEGFSLVWIVVGAGGFLGVVIVIAITVSVLLCQRRSRRAKSTRQQRQGNNGANHSNLRGTDTLVNNPMYDSAIHTTPNMAYCYSVATNHNMAHRPTEDHSVSQSITMNDSEQYEDMDEYTGVYNYI